MRELHARRIREMAVEEVKLKIKDLREELFNLSFRNSMRQLDNPLKIRETRRDLARLMTLLTEHERGIRSFGAASGAASGVAVAPKARRRAASAAEPEAAEAAPKAAKPKAAAKKAAAKPKAKAAKKKTAKKAAKPKAKAAKPKAAKSGGAKAAPARRKSTAKRSARTTSK